MFAGNCRDTSSINHGCLMSYFISRWNCNENVSLPVCAAVVWCWSHGCVLLISHLCIQTLQYSAQRCAWFIAWRPPCFTPLSQCSAITSTGCQGQWAGSTGLECSLVCESVCVCVGVWQAICRLFTLYISLSGCCKSLSVSVRDHLPPGWITFAFLSLSVLLPCRICIIV